MNRVGETRPEESARLFARLSPRPGLSFRPSAIGAIPRARVRDNPRPSYSISFASECQHVPGDGQKRRRAGRESYSSSAFAPFEAMTSLYQRAESFGIRRCEG